MTVSQSFLSCGQGVTPGRMWLVLARQNRYKVLDKPTENKLRIAIGCVSILKDGTLLRVSVKPAIWGSVVRPKSLWPLGVLSSSDIFPGVLNQSGSQTLDAKVSNILQENNHLPYRF